MPDLVARWESVCGTGHEHLVLKLRADGITADGLVITPAADPAGLRYRLVLDTLWRVRDVRAEIIGGHRRLALSSDGEGSWTDGEGVDLPHLAGAIDVDLSASPFTNTLPIRRLGLAPHQSADIVCAYVQVPDLDVFADPQRYTRRAAAGRWLYESRDSDFRCEIGTDADGLVTDYPGLFRRIL